MATVENTRVHTHTHYHHYTTGAPPQPEPAPEPAPAPAPAPSRMLTVPATSPDKHAIVATGSLAVTDAGLEWLDQWKPFKQLWARLNSDPDLTVHRVDVLGVNAFGPFRPTTTTGFAYVNIIADQANPFYRTQAGKAAVTAAGKEICYTDGLEVDEAFRGAPRDEKSVHSARIFVPGLTFIRPDAVGVLTVLKVQDRRIADRFEYMAVLTAQARIPTGTSQLLEIPAGMLEISSTGDMTLQAGPGTAVREMYEETGIVVDSQSGDFIDLGLRLYPEPPTASKKREPSTAPKKREPPSEKFTYYDGMVPSGGGTAEQIQLYLFTKTVTHAELVELTGTITGLQSEENELITLKIVPFRELLTHTLDAKAGVAYAMCASLCSSGDPDFAWFSDATRLYRHHGN
jgi:8-oxo-dGTP pyrophosphatase MutT (NUDIX family)